MNSKLRRFFHGYGLLALILSSVLAFSVAYAEILVNNIPSGGLDNATITVSLTASIPPKAESTYMLAYSYMASVPAAQKLSFPVGYDCELVVNASGVLSTVPCFTTTTTTTESTTTESTTNSTTTTTSSFYAGGGGVALPPPQEPYEPVVPPAVTETKTSWLVSFVKGNFVPFAALVVLGVLLLFASSSGGGRRKR